MLNINNLIKNLKTNTAINPIIIFNKNDIHGYKLGKILSMSFLCNNQNKNICRHCNSCKVFFKKIHPDYYEINCKKEDIQIEKIRQIISNVSKTTYFKIRIILIHSINLININFNNVLLKVLENSKNTIFIITTSCYNLQPTLLNRCIMINQQSYSNIIFENAANILNVYINSITKYPTNTNLDYKEITKKNLEINLIDCIWIALYEILSYKLKIILKINYNTKLHKIIKNIDVKHICKTIDKLNIINYLIKKNYKINLKYIISNILK